MIWTERQYREAGPQDGATGPWVSLPRLPEGSTELRPSVFLLGGSYEVRTRSLDDVTGAAGPWQASLTGVVGYSVPPLPAVRNLRIVCGTQLTWDPPEGGPRGNTRFRVLHCTGDRKHWQDMVAATDELAGPPPFDLCLVPKGRRTLCVVPVDPEGQPGAPAYLALDRGPYDDAEAGEGRRKAWHPSWSGATIVGGTAALGILSQDEVPGAVDDKPFFLDGDDAPFFKGLDSESFYRTSYVEMTVTVPHDVGSLNGLYDLLLDRGVVTLGPNVTGSPNWRCEYRRQPAPFFVGDDEAPFYRGTDDSKFLHGVDDDSPFYGDDDDPFFVGEDTDPFFDEEPWLPWPGRLGGLVREHLDFRIVIPAHWQQAIVATFDQHETFPLRAGEEVADFDADHRLRAAARFLRSGTLANRPAAGTKAEVYFAEDTAQVFAWGPSGWVELARADLLAYAPRWLEASFGYQSFPGAGLSAIFAFFAIGARVVVHEVVAEVLDVWDGPGIDSCTLDVGDDGDPVGLIGGMEMEGVSVGTFLREASGKLHSLTLATVLKARVNVNAASTGALTSGRTRLRMLLSTLP